MSVNVTKKSPEENGVVQWPLNLTSPGPSAASLESVCRSVAELARSAPKPPSRIKLSHGSTTVEMEWPDPVPAPNAPPAPHASVPPTAAQAAPRALSGAESASSPSPDQDDSQAGSQTGSEEDGHGLRFVCAPMVGTYYRAEEPGAAPLVSVGDLVQAGQAVGIFEVMKMLSAVEADVAGRVVEILVADGESVEFQQRLIAVEPVSPGEGG